MAEASGSGANGATTEQYDPTVPSSQQAVLIPLSSGELIEIDRSEIKVDDETFEVYVDTLTGEDCPVQDWCRLAGEYWRLHPTRPDRAIAFAKRGIERASAIDCVVRCSACRSDRQAPDLLAAVVADRPALPGRQLLHRPGPPSAAEDHLRAPSVAVFGCCSSAHAR